MAITTPTSTSQQSLPPQLLTARPAGVFSRTVAFVIDLVILSVVQLVGSLFVPRFLGFFKQINWVEKIITWLETPSIATVISSVVVALVVIGYFLFFWTLVGFTPGKAILGLKIVRKDGAKLSFIRAVLRFFAYWISALPFFLGFFWVLWDSKSRGWHDYIAGTQVLYFPKNPHK